MDVPGLREVGKSRGLLSTLPSSLTMYFSYYKSHGACEKPSKESITIMDHEQE